MFWNIYSKRVLAALRDPDTLIWTMVFPLILATLFNAVFANLDNNGRMQAFPIAVVANEAYYEDVHFRAALESVSVLDSDSDSGESDKLFILVAVDDMAAADELLESGEVSAIIYMDDSPKLAVSGSGISQTIAKSFLDGYLQTSMMIETLMRENPAEISAILGAAYEPESFTEAISLSKNAPTQIVNYFYALLAMVCMYGSFQGLHTINGLQANLSALGARRTLAPIGRFRLLVYDLLGGITIQFFCLLVVITYISAVLGISLGENPWAVLLICLAGTFLGVAFGALVSITSKFKEQAKVAILITFTMVCCFLAGLMVHGVSHAVAQSAPAVAWLNPAARIADAFYCLYYYDTYERFFLNIAVIAAMTTVCFAATALFARRRQYDSI